MSSFQSSLLQVWTRMNETYYRQTASHLPSSFYYIMSPFVSIYFYNRYFDQFSDPKLRHWPLMGSIIWPSIIICFYLAFVYYGFQRLKSNGNEVSSVLRSKTWPHHHNLKSHHHHHYYHGKQTKKEQSLTEKAWFMLILVSYNMTMAILNGWIAYELVFCAWMSGYNFLCQLVYTGTDNEYETRIAVAIWWYFASKGMELFDTILIIVKRKVNQLSFLHIYHHSTMFIVWWVGAKFVPGGSAVTGALVNCIVHVIMYTYYALASIGPKVQPYLWWKKYLTIIQLAQFTLGVTLGLNSILTGCPFTRWMQYVFVCYAFSFLILFGNFYRKTYTSSSETINKKCKNDQNNRTSIKGAKSNEKNFHDSDLNAESEPEKFKKQNSSLKCKRNFVIQQISHRKRKDKRHD